jgi:acyl-CoA reductase-like NAD-dependent aldehyde dehydrogenase
VAPGLLPGDRTGRARVESALQRARAGRCTHRLDPLAVARALGAVSTRFLDPSDPLRREAIRRLAGSTGIHEAGVAAGLDHSFRQWRAPALEALVHAELGPDRERWEGPERLLVVSAGNVPTPLAFDVMCGLLVGAGVVVKPSTREPEMAELFVEALESRAPHLARAVAIASFDGRDRAALEAALVSVDAVIANGSDASVAQVRALAPPGVPVIARGTRLSIGAVSLDGLSSAQAGELAQRAALDVALWEQQGCLSPVAIVVAPAPNLSAHDFARELDEALAKLERDLPLATGDIALRAAMAASVEDLCARALGHPAFTVVSRRVLVDGRGEPVLPLAGRHVFILPTDSALAPPPAVQAWSGRLSAVALEAPPAVRGVAVRAYARLGATRFCRFGALQSPPARWHHDGQDVLRPLVRWLDVE